MRALFIASMLSSSTVLASPPPDVAKTAVAEADSDVAATPAQPTTLPATPAPQPIELTKLKPSKLKDHFMSYVSFGFNAYTYLGASGTSPSTQLDPSKRGIIYQQVGAGYFFHRDLRVQLTFIFGETVSNLPAGASTFTTLAIVPQLVYSTHGFFTGGGPQLAPISYGKAPSFDAGIYTATGYAVKLGKGLSLPVSVQLVIMLNQRTSVAITPAVALAYRY